ncbi:lamin tail domain-containing protein [Colwellia psychrerythraea]|uniref:Intermediate filament domain protein n=1 Tax=Colwellia psychrerythraea TaxID=28229 RepID=A0A099KC60_COLPS|nr:lamin tail domain-containing protein [Colwellia psychrerythraea]KGJ87930.1 Intermediate filament domain protein [Colwellia psychrerythraea]
MENKKKMEIIEQLTRLQNSTDVQKTWLTLGKGVDEYAGVKHQKRIDSCNSGSAFQDWWESCFELLQPRQIIISAVQFDNSRDDKEVNNYIEIHNTGPSIIELTDWTLRSSNQNSDFFHEEQLKPYSKTRIYSDHLLLKKVANSKPLWNQDGDLVAIYDHKGELISSWRYGDTAHSLLSISHICFDGNEKYTEADEYIEVSNTGDSWVDLSNWQLSAGKNQQFIFPENSQLKPWGSIRIYTNHIDESTGGFSFNSKSAIWNNRGDIGILTDYKGRVVSEYRYGNQLVTG